MDSIRVCHPERSGGTRREGIVLRYALMVALALWQIAHGPRAHAYEDGLHEHTGGIVLELDAPSTRTRQPCTTLGVANFGGLPDRSVRLVARSADLLPAGPGPEYTPLAMVALPRSRLGEAKVCLPEVQKLIRTDADGSPLLVEFAVYRVSPHELSTGRWPGPLDDSLRLSQWLPVPDKAWRSHKVFAKGAVK